LAVVSAIPIFSFRDTKESQRNYPCQTQDRDVQFPFSIIPVCLICIPRILTFFNLTNSLWSRRRVALKPISATDSQREQPADKCIAEQYSSLVKWPSNQNNARLTFGGQSRPDQFNSHPISLGKLSGTPDTFLGVCRSLPSPRHATPTVHYGIRLPAAFQPPPSRLRITAIPRDQATRLHSRNCNCSK